MKLAEWARASGAYPQPACRWYRHGTMPDLARRLSSGTILVEARENPPAGRAVVYARLSAHGQCADLDRQIARLTARAIGQGIAVAEVVCEGRLGREPPTVEAQVADRRPAGARDRGGAPPPAGPPRRRAPRGGAFGASRRVVVADPGETSDNLVRDKIDVLVSFCARLYGHRGAHNRVLLALACAKRAPEAARVVGEDD
jgi:putative resolvase